MGASKTRSVGALPKLHSRSQGSLYYSVRRCLLRGKKNPLSTSLQNKIVVQGKARVPDLCNARRGGRLGVSQGEIGVNSTLVYMGEREMASMGTSSALTSFASTF